MQLSFCVVAKFRVNDIWSVIVHVCKYWFSWLRCRLWLLISCHVLWVVGFVVFFVLSYQLCRFVYTVSLLRCCCHHAVVVILWCVVSCQVCSVRGEASGYRHSWSLHLAPNMPVLRIDFTVILLLPLLSCSRFRVIVVVIVCRSCLSWSSLMLLFDCWLCGVLLFPSSVSRTLLAAWFMFRAIVHLWLVVG